MKTLERAVLNFLDELGPVNMHGFLLCRDGETLAEGYWKPFSAEAPHRMYSVSKSVTSLGIGLLMGDGKLRLDDKIVSFFPEWVGEDTPAALREVTLRDMLRMATCYDRAQYVPLQDENWAKPFFHGAATHPHGTLFHYDTSASQVMCALVEKLTGKDILGFLQERLFGPIGMDGEKKWLRDRSGTSQGGTGLLMTLRDFSKLAQFCMSDGRGLIDGAYLRDATGFQIATDERSAPEERFGYGYQFWRMREGFSMYGMGGQMALCLPEKKLSLCTTANTMMSSVGVQPIYDAFFRHLSCADTLERNAEDERELRARLEALALPATGGMQKPARARLTGGELPFDALSVETGAVTLAVKGQTYRLPFGVGEWKEGVFPTSAEPCLTSGGWQDDNRFVLRCELVGDNICGWELFLNRNGDEVSVRTNSTMFECIPGWGGLGYGRMETDGETEK